MARDANEPALTAADSEEGDQPFGLRVYVAAFAACFSFVVIMLWGVYVPTLRSMAAEEVQYGDQFLERATSIRSLSREETQKYIEIAEDIDEKTGKIFPIIRDYEQLQSIGGLHPDVPRILRKLEGELHEWEADVRGLDDYVLKIMSDNDVDETFDTLVSDLKLRATAVDEALDKVIGKKFENTDKDVFGTYSFLCQMQIPFLVTEVKRARDLFDDESCFDRAMQLYSNAIAKARFWSVPRMKLGNLYKQRGWPEFAMAEYLKVIRLDKGGPDAEAAFQEILAYVGRHEEAYFFAGLACLMNEDYDRGMEYLQQFVDNSPGHVLAPKAFQIHERLKENDRTYVKRFLRDEVWI